MADEQFQNRLDVGPNVAQMKEVGVIIIKGQIIV